MPEPDAPGEQYETFNIRWTRSLRLEIERIAHAEVNNKAAVVRRFLTEGIERHRRAVRKQREKVANG